jgi:hypothetical protein
MSTPTATGLRAIEKMKKSIEQKENEFMSWMGDNKMSINALISPTSAGNVEFQKQLTEKKATELASEEERPWYLPDKKPYGKRWWQDLGAKELPPRITERVGPRGIGVVKEDLPIDQRRFDLPTPFADVKYEEQPLPDYYRQDWEDRFTKAGILQPRQSLSELVDAEGRTAMDWITNKYNTEEKWRLLSQQHGFKPELATGGRVPFGKGGMSRRGFLGWLASLIGGAAGIKTGLISFGKGAGTGKTAIKVGDTIVKNTPGMPEWFIPLVNRIVKEGDDVTAKLGTVEREIVHTKKISKGEEVTVYQNLDNGNVRVEYGPTHPRESNNLSTVHLEYRAGEVITEGKHAGKKTKPEFEAVESEPKYVAVGPDDAEVQWDLDNVVGNVDDLTTDTSKLKEFGTNRKLTHKDKVKAKKKQEYRQHLETDTEAQVDYSVNKYGEGQDYDDYLPDIDDMDY